MLQDFRTADALLSMANWIRRLVSQRRRRFTEDGFDLDLAYITDRIIGMGFPGEGGKGLLRNPLQEIVRFLQMKHMGFYKVYNLCKEKSYWYDPQKMCGEVGLFPFEDHQTPPLRLVMEFCEDAKQWLLEDSRNVIAVHCKAGKGRTGTMICCFLIYSGICANAEEAIDLFARRRTMNNKGVTIPSQIRYIRYFEQILKGGELAAVQSLNLESVKICGLPKSIQKRLVLGIWVRPPQSEVHPAAIVRVGRSLNKEWDCTDPFVEEEENHYVVQAEDNDVCVTFDNCPYAGRGGCVVGGDVKVQVFFGSASKKKSMFFAWVNTGLLPANHECTFQRDELDKIRRWVPDGVSLQIKFNPTVECRLGENGMERASSALEASITSPSKIPAMDEMLLNRTSDESATDTSPLITGRHMSMPSDCRVSSFHSALHMQRSNSFSCQWTDSKWKGLNKKWNEKWYLS
ncbi:hypothetical protein BSKO_08774 [Bryopsis sp. KO-2023]|nr:hypothetical protein BSKO_08774 [Bryopsis sp. KO-2023]